MSEITGSRPGRSGAVTYGRGGFHILWAPPPLLICNTCGKRTRLPLKRLGTGPQPGDGYPDRYIDAEDLDELEAAHRCSEADADAPWSIATRTAREGEVCCCGQPAVRAVLLGSGVDVPVCRGGECDELGMS